MTIQSLDQPQANEKAPESLKAPILADHDMSHKSALRQNPQDVDAAQVSQEMYDQLLPLCIIYH